MHAKLAASSTTWTTGLAPLGHISWAQISPFSVDSGAFSIVGRIRDESAVGSHGEIYRGWGARNGREKAGSWTGGRSSSQKGVQHEDFPGGYARFNLLCSGSGATGGTSNLPGGRNFAPLVELRREQPMHAKLAASSTTWTTGLAPLGHISWPKFRRFRWIPARFRSLAAFVMSRPWGLMGRYTGVGVRGTVEKKRESLDGWEEQFAKRGATRGLPRGSPILRSDRWDVESSGGRNFAHWWSYAASSLCTRKLAASSTTWTTGLAPLGHISWPQISPFSVDSGARFRSLAAFVMSRPWGLMGRYTGVGGARNGREKAGKLDGWEEQFAKRGATRGLPRGGATGGTSNLPGGVTLRTGGATPRAAYAREARRELHDVDNWACPVGPHFVAQISPFSVDSGAFFDRVGVRGTVEKKQEAGRVGGAVRKKGCNTRTSQGVTHPSTTLAQARLTSDGATGGTSNLPGGVTLRTGGATPRAAYAREARRELHDVDNWACPVGPHFVAQISPFSVDSGAFSIVGRIRDESGRGVSWGDIQGLGCAERSRKSGKLDGWEEQFAKRGATRGLPRGGATGGTSNLPGGVTLRTGGATPRAAYAREARRELHDVDNWACPVGPHFVAQISPFSVDSGAFSIVGRIRDESAVGSHGEIYRGWGARNGREKAGKLDGWEEQFAKRGATRGLPRGGATGGTSNLPGGVTLRTGGATPRAAYAREARRELHDVDNWACPVGPHFVAQISPFSVDSGAFFDRLAAFVMSRPWGLMGRYTGVGVRGTVEKKREAGRVGGAYYSRPSTLNFGVLMGSGALVLRSDRWDVESSGGRNFAHWWSYAREQPMHAKLAASSTTWTTGLAPLGHISWPKFRRFRWIPARFRSLAAFVMSRPWGLMGRYTGVGGARNGREKAGSWTGGRSSSQKGYYSRPSTLNFGVLMGSGALVLRSDRWDVESSGGRNFAHWWSYAASSLCTRSSPRAPRRGQLGLPPLGHISWPKFSPFSVDSGAFSIVGRIRDESAVGSHGEIYRGWGARNGREKAGSWTGGRSSSQKGVQHEDFPGVTHPSTTLAQARLTSDGATGGTSNLPGGVTLRTGGATPRAAYAREARRELHDVDNWACPVGPHFVAQISPFSVDSGAFSIVGRIRDESAVGSHGEIYRGWGARNGREKAGSWTGGRSSSQKGYYSRPSTLNFGVLMGSGALVLRSDRWDVESSGGRNFAHWWSYAASSLCTRSSPRAPRRGQLGLPRWPHFVAQISPFSVDSGAFSIVGRIRDESAVGLMGRYTGVGVRGTVEKKREAGRVGGAVRKKGCNTRTSQGVTHPSTTLAQARLTSDGATGGTSNLPGGVTLRTGGATPRAAYAREARRELHDVDNWACPVGPHFVAQISPFSVDSGAFSIVGRIRDESAVGSHGEIYRGWGARNGREKAGSWTGGRSSSQKGVQHEDFPGGHPSYGATGGTSNLPGGVTLRTGGATPRAAYAREARRELHDVDNWACPVGPHFVAQISPFSVDSGAFSIVGRIRDESAVGSHGEIYRGWGARNGREKAGSWTGGRSSSQKGYYSRPSTLNFGVLMGSGALVLRSDRWDVESSGGVTLRTGGATPRAAYAREARRELHDVDNWACPVGPHFVAQISPFSVDSGAFSIVGRIRDESAVGSHGEIYRGWGARNGREKAGSWTGGRSSSQKGVQHEDFPGGHPSYGATGGTSNLPGGVTLRTGGATPRAAYAREARRELHDVDNWACPVGPHFVAQISPFSVDSGAFSIVGRIRDESAVGLMGRYTGVGVRGTVEKKREAGRVGGAVRKKGCNTRTSQGVTHPSTTLAQARLTSDGATGGTSNLPGGVTLRTGGATPRAAYAREARRELHDVDNWACPVGPHFVAQISPFSVDSGAFSIVGRIRDESAVGSHGEIYRGWGARNGREKAGSWTGGRSSSQKGVQHEDFPGDMRALTFYALAAERQLRREQPMHAKLAASSTTWTTGLAPLGHISWPKFHRFRWIPARFRSLAAFVMSRPWGLMGRYTGVGVRGTVEKKREAGRVGGAVRKKGCNTRTSQGVTHPSTTLAQARLTSDGATGGTSNLPGGVTLRTGGATPRAAYAREARRELHDVDNWACPVGPHFVAQISPFSVDSGAFSIVGRIRDESAVGLMGRYTGVGVRGTVEKKREAGRVGGAVRKKGCNTRTSQGVTHPSTTLAQARLTSDGATGGTSNLPGGVTLRTGGATPRAAYAREARRELHDVDNWACPVGPHFVAQISRFRWIPARFRSLAAFVMSRPWGLMGRYTGVGVRGTVEKKREAGRVGGAYYSRPSTLNFGVLMGSGALVLRSDRWDVESSGGVTLRTGGATPRAAYAREARRELHDVDNWACPVGPHFVAQISPFSVDSGAFSIVGRIRDESAVGSHGGDIQGLGCAERSRKSRKLDGWEEQFAKRGATRGLPRGYARFNLLCSGSGATGGTSNLPGGVTLRTGGATPRAAYAREARRELHDVDNWACPVGPHFRGPNFDRFRWIPARFRSLAAFVMSRPWGLMGRYTGVGRGGTVEKKREAGRVGGAVRKKGCNTRTSQGVTHPSTTLAQARLTSEVLMGSGALVLRSDRWDVESSGGRNFAHWWSYAASSLCTRSSPRAPRRGQLGLPRWATFRGPNFAVFGGFRRRFRSLAAFVDESAVGLMGRYTGVGVARNGREKAEAGRVGGAVRKKGCNTRTSQGVTHPSTTLRPSTLNFGVLMGSGCISAGGTSNLPGGVTLRTGGATPASSLCHAKLAASSTTWTTGLAPLGTFRGPNFARFRWIPARFRSLAAFVMSRPWVSWEIYRGWGARNGREKSGKLDGVGGAYYSRPSTLNFGVLMGSGALVLRSDRVGRRIFRGGVTLRHWWSYAREQPMHAKARPRAPTTWTTGLAPLGHISWPQISPRFPVDSGAFSIVGRIRDESAVGSHGEIYRGWVCAERSRKKQGSWTGGRSSSQKGVQHEDFPGDMRALTFYALASGATGGTSNLPGGVTLRTGGATPRAAYAREARRELHDVDNWACPVGPHFVAQISPFSGGFRRAFSIVGRIRDESARGSHGEIYRGWGARNGREKAESWTGGRSSSQKGVQHEDFPGAERTGGTSNLPGGRNFAHWWATPRAAYAREARRELHDVDNWACPVGPHFVAQISPFSVDSGAFSIVGRIRDESAVGSHGEIYRGWVCAERSRKKAGSWTGGGAVRKKGATRGLPRGSPILVLLSPKHA
ncbi:UNVERIFIED_CONTAM: hypothetical protein Sindi_2921500 [Sesamum indicum]